MGVPNRNDGSIERADLDGRNRTTIVPPGGAFTPKQMKIEQKSGKLYWCDREGMRLMRATSTVRTSRPSWTRARAILDRGRMPRSYAWASPSMSMAARSTGRKKAERTRARAHLPRQYRHSARSDARPIAGTSNCSTTGCPSRSTWRSTRPPAAVLDGPWRSASRQHRQPRAPRRAIRQAPAPEILFTHLEEGIGMALDLKGGRMFITDLAGSVYSPGSMARRSGRYWQPRATSPASHTFEHTSSTGD